MEETLCLILEDFLQLVVSFCQNIAYYLIDIERLLESNISQDALLAIPALFVALLVPITFFLMERQDLFGFDKNVILDRIILVKSSIPLTFLMSLSLLFNITTLSLLLSISLLIVVVIVLIRVYKWMASVEEINCKITYKQAMRLRFIREIKNDVEKLDTWALILNDEKLSEKNQRGLIDEYINTAKSLRDGKRRYPKSTLLGLMSNNLNKINFTDIQTYENLVKFSIEYFWEMHEARLRHAETKEDHTIASYPPHYQRELALNLLRIALDRKINDIFDYVYFMTIKKYATENGLDEAIFIRDFLPSYINIARENEEYDSKALWQTLPDWIVTKELLLKPDTQAKATSVLNAYMEAISRHARSDKEMSSHEVEIIDEITEYILPNINVPFWFDVLIFYNDAWGVDEGEDITHGQIREFVSGRRNFGLFNAVGGQGWSEDADTRMKSFQEEVKKQDDETIYILQQAYPWLQNPSQIQKVLHQIGIIESEKLYKSDSYEARRLGSLKAHFEKIKASIVSSSSRQRASRDKK